MKFEYKGFTVIPTNQGIKLVKGNQEKAVKVVDCTEYRYRLTKTKIYAADGPYTLVDWMERNIDLFECNIRKIIEYAWYEMRETK